MKSLLDLSRNRENNITFMRLLAALSVIYGHSFAISPSTVEKDWVIEKIGIFSGGIGVDFFFLLSGYLVCASLQSKGIAHYVVARVFRLLPALIIMLALTSFVIGPIISNLSIIDYFTNGQTHRYFFFLATLFKGEFLLPGVFTHNPLDAVNGPLWSVLFESKMYILLAFGYLLGLIRENKKTLFNGLYFLLIFLVWSDTLKIPMLISHLESRVAFLFLTGVFLWINRANVYVTPMTLLFALFFAAYTVGTAKFYLAYLLVLIIFFCVFSFGSRFYFMEKIGDFSYGIYLWGWPVSQIIYEQFPGMGPVLNSLATMVIAFLLGAMSWFFIEKPIMRSRFRKNLEIFLEMNLIKIRKLPGKILNITPLKG